MLRMPPHGSESGFGRRRAQCAWDSAPGSGFSARRRRGGTMDKAPYHLDQDRRDAVVEAIQKVCGQRGWSLLAAHVRSNHVHTVVQAEVPPERS